MTPRRDSRNERWVFLMSDKTRWEGDADGFCQALQKAERETGKRAVYMLAPTDDEANNAAAASNGKRAREAP